MRVDEARHHDLAARIDHVGAAGGQARPDREDLLAFDQHVAARKVAATPEPWSIDMTEPPLIR